MSATDKQIRAIWLAVTMLTGAIIGTAAGLLSWAGGTNPSTPSSPAQAPSPEP
jgi:hypothetical protein